MREPCLAICAPAIGIITSEPTPKTRIISPSSNLESTRRSAKSGIFGAQQPTTKPFIRKSRETAALLLVTNPLRAPGGAFT